jgi:hypothetical protein
MRGKGFGVGRLGGLAIAALAVTGLTVAQPAQAADEWQEPTAASFWSKAATASTATVYAPSTAALRRARAGRLNFASTSLRMYCRGQWSVTAVYDDSLLTIDQGTDNGVGQYTCVGDGPGAGPDKTGTRVNAAGGRFEVYFQGCDEGVSQTQQDGLPEATCPTAKANYVAFGRLPAVGGKKATFMQMQSRGLSRQQLSRVIRSLAVVRAS